MAWRGNKNAFWLLPPFLVMIGLALYFIFFFSTAEKSPPNVILITMDSLRHDRLGCTGYPRAHTPNIDALAQDGVVFREAITQGTYTRVSLPSIAASNFPYYTGVRTFNVSLDTAQTTVAEVLSGNGYATLANNILWSARNFQGFKITGRSRETTASRTQQVIRGLEEYRDQKFFIWLYYWDPHAPYEPQEEFMRIYESDYVKSDPAKRKKNANQKSASPAQKEIDGAVRNLLLLNRGEIELDPSESQHLTDLYNAEIAGVDAGIGELVAKLKETGRYDSTLIVLNADHGEGFGEHGAWYHGTTVYDEMARIPLIIKPPASTNMNKVVWGQVRNIDIAPTILDYCGLPAPESWAGRSLRPFIEGRVTPDLPSITETPLGKTSHLLAFRHRGYKLICDLISDEVWLYDLKTDPGETDDLLAHSTGGGFSAEEKSSPARQQEQQLRGELLDLLGLEQWSDLGLTEMQLGPVDPQTKEKLKALGYVY